MRHIVKTTKQMVDLGQKLAKQLPIPGAVELIGDVGVGKTTLVQGIAKGLGVKEPVTSPSFTVNKQYVVNNTTISHYDFYRLPDAGILTNEIAEAMQDQHTLVLVEWAGDVTSILPPNHVRININYNDDGSRAVKIKGLPK